jgi:hypothetical protein
VDHQEDRPSLGETAHRVDHVALGRSVQRRRRLVQQEQRPVGQERPGQGQPLALARRQSRAVLAQHRPGTRRQRVHELGRPRVAQCPRHGVVVGVRPGEAHVLRDGPGEEVRPLGHPGDPLPPALRVHRPQFDSPDAYRTAVLRRLHEPQHHVQQRRLADPARSDQGDRLSRFDDE